MRIRKGIQLGAFSYAIDLYLVQQKLKLALLSN